MDHANRVALLQIARAALTDAVHGGEEAKKLSALFLETAAYQPLRRAAGAFVTLHRKDGSVRGCVGAMEAPTMLVSVVSEMTQAAAQRDPRFDTVRSDEVDDLYIEISVLSSSIPVASLDEVVVGRDGLMVSGRGKRGVLLPQVATERRWDVRKFVEETCRKAGLHHDAHRADDVEVYRFEAEIIREPDELKQLA